MSALKKAVDLKALENELDDAVKADELYKLQNDAKLRAIGQKVSTYEHFRNMVLTAHLKPLERSELHKNKTRVSWNRACGGANTKNNEDEDDDGCYQQDEEQEEEMEKKVEGEENVAVVEDDNDESKDEAGSSEESEFLNDWKSTANYAERFELLVRHKDSMKDRYFNSAQPSMDFLVESLNCCRNNCTKDKMIAIIEILEIFAVRFRKNLWMLPITDKTRVKWMFERLLEFVDDNDRGTMSRIKFLIMDYCISQ